MLEQWSMLLLTYYSRWHNWCQPINRAVTASYTSYNKVLKFIERNYYLLRSILTNRKSRYSEILLTKRNPPIMLKILPMLCCTAIMLCNQ